MTLPALTANYKRQVYSTRIKKFYSTFEQAIKMSEVTNGSPLYWSKEATVTDEDGNTDYEANADLNVVFLKKYILPYMKYVSEGKKNWSSGKKYETVVLADGSEFSLHNGSCIDIVYDINGLAKAPNQEGADRFRFVMCFDEGNRNYHFKNKKRFFGPYWHYYSRETALSGCKSAPGFCSALLEYDGWEFKEDYPYKL